MSTKYVMATPELISKLRAKARHWADEEHFSCSVEHIITVVSEYLLNERGYTQFEEKATYGVE